MPGPQVVVEHLTQRRADNDDLRGRPAGVALDRAVAADSSREGQAQGVPLALGAAQFDTKLLAFRNHTHGRRQGAERGTDALRANERVDVAGENLGRKHASDQASGVPLGGGRG